MGTVVNFNVKGADAQPIPNAIYDITLTESGVDFLGESLILPTSLNGTADTNGEFQVELAPVSTAPYVIVILDSDGRRKGVFEFIVPDSASPVNADDLTIFPKPSNVNYDAIALAAIVDSRVRAEQAAEMLEEYNSPRYQVRNLTFADVSGTQTASLSLDDNGGYIQVTETEGQVIVPLDTTMDFPIGSALVFVNNTDPKVVIDVEFNPETAGVTVDFVGLAEIKLTATSDMVALVKVAANSWKVLNNAGAGGSYDTAILALSQEITEIQDAITNLEGWRAAYDTQLNAQSSTISSHTLSLAQVNSALASLNAALADMNSSINARINAAIPGLGDLTSYVTDAENAKIAAEAAVVTTDANVIAAGISAAAAVISEGNALAYAGTAETHKDDAETAQVAAELAETNALAAAASIAAEYNYFAVDSMYTTGQLFDPGERTYGVRMHTDGLKMWIVGTNEYLREYALSTAYDVSTATLTTSVDLNALGIDAPKDFAISGDGLEFYVVDDVNDRIWQLTFTSAHDISTYDSIQYVSSTTIRTGMNEPVGIEVRDDGSRMWILSNGYGGGSENWFFEFDLTGGDVTTASYTSESHEVRSSSGEYEGINLRMNADGTAFYQLYDHNPSNTSNMERPGIYKIHLDTAYDLVSEANEIHFRLGGKLPEHGVLYGFTFSPDGKYLYLSLDLDGPGDCILQFKCIGN